MRAHAAAVRRGSQPGGQLACLAPDLGDVRAAAAGVDGAESRQRRVGGAVGDSHVVNCTPLLREPGGAQERLPRRPEDGRRSAQALDEAAAGGCEGAGFVEDPARPLYELRDPPPVGSLFAASVLAAARSFSTASREAGGSGDPGHLLLEPRELAPDGGGVPRGRDGDVAHRQVAADVLDHAGVLTADRELGHLTCRQTACRSG